MLGDDGRPRLRGVGVLIRWEEVMYLEFIDSRAAEPAQEGEQ
jgi:hypothetical protein